jgi:uncharacterized membrane protein (DUF2068 family)
MNRLTRSNALKIAAGIVLLLALLDLFVYEIPALMLGQAAVDHVASADGSGPPFFMVLLGSAMDVLGIVTAYGLWRGQRWGVVLAIIISAFNVLSGLAGALSAGDVGTRIFAGVGVVLSVVIIALCLWRERKPQSRAVQTS